MEASSYSHGAPERHEAPNREHNGWQELNPNPVKSHADPAAHRRNRPSVTLTTLKSASIINGSYRTTINRPRRLRGYPASPNLWDPIPGSLTRYPGPS